MRKLLSEEEEKMNKCDHNWVFENRMLLSNPPQCNKICSKCGEIGRDTIGTIVSPEETYDGLMSKFAKRGENDKK